MKPRTPPERPSHRLVVVRHDGKPKLSFACQYPKKFKLSYFNEKIAFWKGEEKRLFFLGLYDCCDYGEAVRKHTFWRFWRDYYYDPRALDDWWFPVVEEEIIYDDNDDNDDINGSHSDSNDDENKYEEIEENKNDNDHSMVINGNIPSGEKSEKSMEIENESKYLEDEENEIGRNELNKNGDIEENGIKNVKNEGIQGMDQMQSIWERYKGKFDFIFCLKNKKIKR